MLSDNTNEQLYIKVDSFADLHLALTICNTVITSAFKGNCAYYLVFYSLTLKKYISGFFIFFPFLLFLYCIMTGRVHVYVHLQ